VTAITLLLLGMRLCSDSHSGQKQSPLPRSGKGPEVVSASEAEDHVNRRLHLDWIAVKEIRTIAP